MPIHRLLPTRVAPAVALGALLAWGTPARALDWVWQYADGAQIDARGTFVTTDVAQDGWYEITAIAGERDGVAITALQPAGTWIPGNAPYAVDNLVRANGLQLTGNGFGFTTADGNASNPFYADWAPGYVEFHAIGPDGAIHTELDVRFSAHLAAVPEPAPAALWAVGLMGLGLGMARRRRG
jgi:hypothetical protein